MQRTVAVEQPRVPVAAADRGVEDGAGRHRRVERVGTEQVGGHRIGYRQLPRQVGPIVRHRQQAAVDQRASRTDPSSPVGRRRIDARQQQGQLHRRPTSRDVVVQVAVEPFDGLVDIGQERGQQHVDVRIVEAERRCHPSQAQAVLARDVGGPGPALDAVALAPIVERQVPRRTGSGDRADLRVADVEPAEVVVGLRIGPPAVLDEPGGPLAHQRQACPHVVERCHVGAPADATGGPRHGPGRPRGRAEVGGRPGRVEVGHDALGPRRDDVGLAHGHGRDDHDVERWLQLAAHRRPHVADGPVLRGRERHRHGDRPRRRQQVALQQIGRQAVRPEEAAEHLGEQQVLLLGLAGPRRHQVAEPEVARRRVASP